MAKRKKTTKATAPPACPEKIRIGTLVSAGAKAAEYIRQILPHGFESFSLTPWQVLGGDLKKIATEVNDVHKGERRLRTMSNKCWP